MFVSALVTLKTVISYELENNVPREKSSANGSRALLSGVAAHAEGLGKCPAQLSSHCLLSATTLGHGHCLAVLIMKTGGAAAKVELTRHSLWFHGTVSLLVCLVSQGTRA